MIDLNLFPQSITIRQCHPNQISGELYPAERQLIEGACAGRKLEFRAGRLLAKELLRVKGIEGFPLLAGERREPLWPQMISGSITHLSDICVVVVALKSKVFALGVDIARMGDVKPDIWSTFMTGEELAWIESLPAPVAHRFAAMIFSAKESLFKCLYPVSHIWIDFKDISISLNEAYQQFRRARFSSNYEDDELMRLGHPFTAKFVKSKPEGFMVGTSIRGVYQFCDPYVVTGMHLTREQMPQRMSTSAQPREGVMPS